jgi:hypothetical protein
MQSVCFGALTSVRRLGWVDIVRLIAPPQRRLAAHGSFDTSVAAKNGTLHVLPRRTPTIGFDFIRSRQLMM